MKTIVGYIKPVFTIWAVALSYWLAGQSIDSRLETIDNLIESNNIILSIEVIEKLLTDDKISNQLSPLQKANLLNNLGYGYIKIKKNETAKKHIEEAISIYNNNPSLPTDDITFLQQNMGSILLEEGAYDEARNYLVKAIDEAAKTYGTESHEYASAQSKLGSLFEEVGYYDLALEYFNKAHNILVKTHGERSPEHAEISNHLGRIMIKNGNLSKSKEYLQVSTSTFESLGENYKIDYAESLEALGMFYEAEGNFAEAEKILLKTLNLKKTIDNLPENLLVETLNDLGILYQDLGNNQQAESYFNEVHQICIDHLGTDNQYYATAINNLAVLYQQDGEFEKAKSLFVEALPVYERRYGKRHPSYADALNNLASTERTLGNYSIAEKYYLEVLQIDEQVYGKDHPDYATTLNNLGILYSTMGQPDKAIRYYLEAVDIRKEKLGVNHPTYSRSLENIGLHYFAQNDLIKAEKYLKDALSIQTDQISSIFPIQTEREKELFYEDIRRDVERYNHIAIRLLDQKPELIEQVLENQIQTKAILFSSIEKIQENVISSGDAELINLYNQWKSLKTKLASYYQIGKTKLKEYNINLNNIEDSVENMEKAIMLKSSQFADYIGGEKVTWKSIQKSLEPDEAALEIIRVRDFATAKHGDRQVFGFSDALMYLLVIVKPGQSTPAFVLIENGVQLEDKLYAAYKNALQYQFDESASYKLVWQNVDEKLSGIKKLYVSPDGIFFKINPNTFKLTDGRYLIDKYYVSFITNCEDLLNKKSPNTLNTASFFGNPTFGAASEKAFELQQLPGAEEEIKIASKDLESKKWQTSLFIGDNASEQKLKSISSPKILHIATHGYFSDKSNVLSRVIKSDNPLFKSGIFMSGASTSMSAYAKGNSQPNLNDGILSAYEAMNLNLEGTELVVLSACETGLGDVTNGEGVYGLQRSFLVAGTKYLITSLVKVDDKATQELMNNFYLNYLKSDNITESLFQAQLKLRENYPNPLIWGSFILVGHG